MCDEAADSASPGVPASLHLLPRQSGSRGPVQESAAHLRLPDPGITHRALTLSEHRDPATPTTSMGPSVRSPLKRCDYPLPKPARKGHAILSAGPALFAAATAAPSQRVRGTARAALQLQGTITRHAPHTTKGFSLLAALPICPSRLESLADGRCWALQYLRCIASASPRPELSPSVEPRRADHAALPLKLVAYSSRSLWRTVTSCLRL
jgi:hypothetical protein